MQEPTMEAGQPLQKEPTDYSADWFKTKGWSNNPFIFSINPALLVGYETQKRDLLSAVEQKHKVIMLLGPTGSGKTTLLKWLSRNAPSKTHAIYLSKPPQRAEDFVDIINEAFRPIFFRKIKNVYQITDFLNKKGDILLICDEIHETNVDVLEWLRVLSDQVEHMTLILAGLPVFEEKLAGRLESLRKRVASRTGLLSLTKEETRMLIEKRIESVGGRGIEPFEEKTIDAIYEQTGGFPREVLRLCDILVNKAMKSGTEKITPDLLEKYQEPQAQISLDSIPKKQRHVLELLLEPLKTGDLAEQLGVDKYKSRQHAVRSVNNILKRLMKDGYIERRRSGTSYEYIVKPEFKTIIVKT
ncbi:MAG: AAA family ATPase [Candidatus Aenigmarchaeota archaeon]|nr:AAA family ATPase [Candidatus Aenigmarchaeota archaeon]